MASILLFREKFPREARKNDVAHPGLARFANFFSLDSHAKSAISHLVARGRHGSSARDALWRRARAWTFACPDSTFSFPFPPSRGSRVQRDARCFSSYDTFDQVATGSERKRNERGTERRRWKRGEQRIVPTGFTRSLWTGRRGDTSLVCEGERRGRREGVILPCVTRITRAALKSTRRTFYRGQS